MNLGPHAVSLYSTRFAFTFGVLDIIEAKQGEMAMDKGSQQHVIVMQRDSKKYSAIGGFCLLLRATAIADSQP